MTQCISTRVHLAATYNHVTCKSIVISSRNCVDGIELASYFLRRLAMVPNIPDWANSMLSVAPLWSDHGPLAACRSAGAGLISHHWPCRFQGKLSQSHVIGMVSLERGWANSKPPVASPWRDRKSTRLNSSHANISYAVFCLKKKKESPMRLIQH